MKKIFVLSISLVISIGIIVGAVFFKNIDRAAKLFKKNMEILAQESFYYFMPFFSDRLKYLASEIYLTSNDLNILTEEIKGLYEECSCSNTQSICGFQNTIGFQQISSFLSTNNFPSLYIGGEISGGFSGSRIGDLSPGQINDFIRGFTQKHKDLFENFETNKQTLINSFKQEFEIFARMPLEQYFGIPNEEVAKQLLEGVEQSLQNLAQSILSGGCLATGVFGDVCKNNRNEIEKKKGEIADRIERISRLKLLLEREQEIALDTELETLRSEDANDLREKLNLLKSETETLLTNAEEIYNYYIYDKNCKNICIGRCTSKTNLDFQACINIASKQEPMKVKFDIGVELQDLELGEVGLDFRLNLPEEINIPRLPKIPSFSLPLNTSLVFNFPDIVPSRTGDIDMDFSNTPFILSSPLPPQINFDQLSFSCPDLNRYKKTSYTWGGELSKSEVNNTDSEWFFDTFSWLTEQCINLNSISDSSKGRVSKKCEEVASKEDCESLKQTRGSAKLLTGDDYKSCLDPNEVYKKIEMECNRGDGSQLCKEMGRKNTFKRAEFIQEKCEEAGGGANCAIDYYCFALPRGKTEYARGITSDCGRWGYSYIAKQDVDRAIKTLEDKCLDFRRSGDKIDKHPECQYLPLITGKFPIPSERTYYYKNIPLPEVSPSDQMQHFFNISGSIPGCFLDFENQASIQFPTIIIPDIQLPTFNLCPIFAVKLPKIIFEDLVLPPLNLPDISNCANLFGDLTFPFLHLDIPQIMAEFDIPSLNVFIQNIGNIRIKPPSLEISGISFPMFSLFLENFFNMGDILIAEIKMPSIPFPNINFYVRFAGFELNLASILLGLIKPDYNYAQCQSYNLSIGCKTFGLGDTILNWPRFPKISKKIEKVIDGVVREIDKVSDFCQAIDKEVGPEIRNAKQKIEKTVNDVLNPVQEQLDILSSEIQKTIQDEIINEIQNEINSLTYKTEIGIDALKAKLEDKIREHIQKAVGEDKDPRTSFRDGVLKIPPLVIPLKDIIGKEEIKILKNDIDLQDLIEKKVIKRKMPKFQTIPWPNELKNIINKNKSFTYQLPPVPLSELNWHRTYQFKIPGLQVPSFNFNLSLDALNYPGCKAERPVQIIKPCSSSNAGIEDNLKQLQDTSQKIIDILR